MKKRIFYRPPRLIDRSVLSHRYRRAYRAFLVTDRPISANYSSGGKNKRILSGSERNDRVTSGSYTHRTRIERNSGNALYGIEQFQLGRILRHCDFRCFYRCRSCCRRNTEQGKTGRIETAGRSHTKRNIRRKAGGQPIDDDLSYIERPEIR